MNFNEIIRTAMKETNTTQTQLGNLLGVRQSTIGNSLSRNDIYANTLVHMLDKLGYEVVIQKKETADKLKQTRKQLEELKAQIQNLLIALDEIEEQRENRMVLTAEKCDSKSEV